MNHTLPDHEMQSQLKNNSFITQHDQRIVLPGLRQSDLCPIMKVDLMLSFPPSTYEKTAYLKAALKKQAGMTEPCTEIIGKYLALNSNFTRATELLQFDRYGQVTNQPVYEEIREALISNVCELQIKRQIILNLLSDKSNISRTIFNLLQKEIRASGYQVNLDCVDLSYLKLVKLNFNAMSMKYVDFSHSVIYGSKFANTDLSESDFSSARLRMVNMENALLVNVNWTAARLNRLNMFGAVEVDLTKAHEVKRIWIDTGMLDEMESAGKYWIVRNDPNDRQERSQLTRSDTNPCCCIFL